MKRILTLIITVVVLSMTSKVSKASGINNDYYFYEGNIEVTYLNGDIGRISFNIITTLDTKGLSLKDGCLTRFISSYNYKPITCNIKSFRIIHDNCTLVQNRDGSQIEYDFIKINEYIKIYNF